MMRLERRVALLAAALVPLGTIGGHVAGQVLAGGPAGLDGSHSHLRPATWITALAALAALGWIGAARSSRTARLPLSMLAVGQAVLFLGLEAGEQLVGGHALGHLPSDPAVRWGLVAQLATAALLVAAVSAARASGRCVRALLGTRTVPGGRPAEVGRPTGAGALRSLLLGSPASERGPPSSPVAA